MSSGYRCLIYKLLANTGTGTNCVSHQTHNKCDSIFQSKAAGSSKGWMN